MRPRLFPAAAALLLLLTALGAESGTHAAPAGIWGGTHAALTLTESGGRIELDCAHGTVDETLAVDANGHFDAGGTFSREHGGPIRREEREERRPARYSGTIRGETMTLTITVPGLGPGFGPFTLELGKGGIIHKCL